MALEQESAQTFQYLCTQVAGLQKAFTTLADSVIEELDTVREEQRQWAEERDTWAASMNKMHKVREGGAM